MTCEYFQMFDVSCACVASVAEYEEFMKENTIELLLLDVNLENESGFLLCKKIREESDLPIIFISARQSDDDMLTALNIGGDDYIKKPYTLSILFAKVKVVLKRFGKAEYLAENRTCSISGHGRMVAAQEKSRRRGSRIKTHSEEEL